MNRVSLFLFDFAKGRKTLHYLKEYERTKSLSKDELVNYQIKKIKSLLDHANRNVTFYNKRFKEAGFNAEMFKYHDQLVNIPPLTRADLQDHWRDIIVTDARLSNLSKGSSSGSTGHPVVYFKDRNASSAGQAAHIIGWMLSGWRMNMKGLHIWGNPSTVNNEWKRLSSIVKAKLFRHHKYPAYKLTDGQRFYELFNLINRSRYDYIDGYTNAIYLFADFLQQNKLELDYSPEYVLTTAENLQDFQRKTIEERIAPVYDTYGCSEVNGIAYECHICKMYHVIDPHVYLEFGNSLDDIGSRELLITDLDNYAFPLIRYQNGDAGVPNMKKSECTLHYSQMKSVSGRQSDIIKLKGGGALSVPSFFGSMLLKEINGIKQYQIERISSEKIYVNFVISNSFSRDDEAKLNRAMVDYLDDKLLYEIRFVEKLETSATGKFKLLVDRTQ